MILNALDIIIALGFGISALAVLMDIVPALLAPVLVLIGLSESDPS